MIKAVIVGINDYPSAPLAGCVNDADDVADYIITKFGPRDAAITSIKNGDATKSAICKALRDMITDANADDHLLFHYSGHGSQVLSQDISEPDGLDECLCPVDFGFAFPDTAFRDKELSALLASVPPSITMTIVLDSCHSGDMAREPKRSFPGMPQALQALVSKSNRAPSTKRRAYSVNTVVVSACASNETAADTVFNGRPNGAFTYYWLGALAKAGAAPLTTVLRNVAQPLGRFQMHPMLDSSAGNLQLAPFLTGATNEERAANLAVSRATTDVFAEEWHTRVLGMTFSVGLRIGIAEGTLLFDLANNAGVPLHWSFVVDDEVSKSFDIGLGFRIQLGVSDLIVALATTSFQLSIGVAPPFLGTTPIVDRRVVLPVQPGPRGPLSTGPRKLVDITRRS